MWSRSEVEWRKHPEPKERSGRFRAGLLFRHVLIGALPGPGQPWPIDVLVVVGYAMCALLG